MMSLHHGGVSSFPDPKIPRRPSAGRVFSQPLSPRTTAAIAWSKALAESETDWAAGEVVSGDDVIRELRASIARMEAKRPAQ